MHGFFSCKLHRGLDKGPAAGCDMISFKLTSALGVPVEVPVARLPVVPVLATVSLAAVTHTAW